MILSASLLVSLLIPGLAKRKHGSSSVVQQTGALMRQEKIIGDTVQDDEKKSSSTARITDPGKPGKRQWTHQPKGVHKGYELWTSNFPHYVEGILALEIMLIMHFVKFFKFPLIISRIGIQLHVHGMLCRWHYSGRTHKSYLATQCQLAKS